jgi:hypothetical protein
MTKPIKIGGLLIAHVIAVLVGYGYGNYHSQKILTNQFERLFVETCSITLGENVNVLKQLRAGENEKAAETLERQVDNELSFLASFSDMRK